MARRRPRSDFFFLSGQQLRAASHQLCGYSFQSERRRYSKVGRNYGLTANQMYAALLRWWDQ